MTTFTARIPGRRAKAAAARADVAVPAEMAVLSEALAVVSVLCAWVLLQVLVLGGLSFDRSQTVLYDRFRTEVASATAPVGGVIAVGTPVATVDVARFGTSLVVVEGTSSTQTLQGPGHRRDTVLPGQPGTSVVYGRSSTYRAPFGDLGTLRPGDRITTVTGQGRATFEVTGLRRAGDPLPQPLAAGAGRLTLVGAEGDGRLSALSPGQVLYVDADLVSKPFDLGEPRLAGVTDAEQPMGRDTGVLPVLTLALAGLVALVAAAVALRPRLGTARTWVLLTAPVVALAWVTTDVAMGLLPNLM